MKSSSAAIRCCRPDTGCRRSKIRAVGARPRRPALLRRVKTPNLVRPDVKASSIALSVIRQEAIRFASKSLFHGSSNIIPVLISKRPFQRIKVVTTRRSFAGIPLFHFNVCRDGPNTLQIRSCSNSYFMKPAGDGCADIPQLSNSRISAGHFGSSIKNTDRSERSLIAPFVDTARTLRNATIAPHIIDGEAR